MSNEEAIQRRAPDRSQDEISCRYCDRVMPLHHAKNLGSFDRPVFLCERCYLDALVRRDQLGHAVLIRIEQFRSNRSAQHA